VDDCVEALLAMLAPEHDGRTYNVASGHAITVNELTRLMLEASGSDLEPVNGPPDETAGTVRKGSPTLAPRQLAREAKTPISERLRDSRMLFSRVLNLLLNIAFRTWATDSKSGFVLAPHRVLEDVLSYRGRYRYFQTFISVAAKSKGYEVLEVETLFQSRYAG